MRSREDGQRLHDPDVRADVGAVARLELPEQEHESEDREPGGAGDDREGEVAPVQPRRKLGGSSTSSERTPGALANEGACRRRLPPRPVATTVTQT